MNNTQTENGGTVRCTGLLAELEAELTRQRRARNRATKRGDVETWGRRVYDCEALRRVVEIMRSRSATDEAQRHGEENP